MAKTEIKEGKQKPDKKPQDKKQKKEVKKDGFFKRMGRKLKETFSELKNVTWPTVPQALKSTGIVLVVVLAFTVLVTCVNVGFSELLELMTSWGV